jgi:hypothetical protein
MSWPCNLEIFQPLPLPYICSTIYSNIHGFVSNKHSANFCNSTKKSTNGDEVRRVITNREKIVMMVITAQELHLHSADGTASLLFYNSFLNEGNYFYFHVFPRLSRVRGLYLDVANLKKRPDRQFAENSSGAAHRHPEPRGCEEPRATLARNGDTSGVPEKNLNRAHVYPRNYHNFVKIDYNPQGGVCYRQCN